MKPLKVLITILLLLTFSLSYAQKATMEKANMLYKLESYAEAIPLFQKVLADKESLPGRTKLAYSLMILNRMEEAEQEYRKIIPLENHMFLVLSNDNKALIIQSKFN